MRLSRLGSFVLLVFAKSSFAQPPPDPAPAASPAESAPTESAPTQGAQLEPPAPSPPPAPEPPPAEPAPPAEEAPLPEAAPAPSPVPAPAAEKPTSLGPAPVIASTEAKPAADVGKLAPWQRARSPLTLEGSLGLMARPQSSAGFDDESQVGTSLGLSLYMDLKKEIAAGLEIERASLGRGAAQSGLDSVSVDYSVSSAMLGFRAYPKRGDFFDLFVGLQVGVGIQGVSATGTESNGALVPASAYSCGGSDSPAFQLGGGVGARLMISERWGLSARITGTGRRLTGEFVDDCARGIGTATTVSGSLGLGYDFELDP
jgi:hypothetical protein